MVLLLAKSRITATGRVAGFCSYSMPRSFVTSTSKPASAASASSDPNNSTAWNVSPNPFSDQLVVNSKALSAGLANYLLTDALGQAIRQGVLSGNRMEIDTRELPAGAYFICIETENGREARKVIKL